ncbi:serine hydroxymethyltransferase [Buchnera aphidicola (Thelaxes californica)]|uniref:Serine hydroxymethyltransferase n=1 Tax=Buchnera aphidicola (Thelaxes californica) TaxID=1315998 RepID=A0A4D6Y9R7_9GAMM|nr:serine hydroxymethyltransferase [Buchnera aphidicola]QCI26756.1 serine hydroxymethyltransferase [Buchnera aphidicola (Thelaxes californica)]
MLKSNILLKNYDKTIWDILQLEKKRQEEHIELIASENYASRLILELQGSEFTNKYAEGYPEKRYYGGCQNVDLIENIAIQRAKKLFQADYVNVQPHSGSQANFAVYNALLKPGDLILGMNLSHGGHLTHGSKVNFSGKIYNSIFYGVDKKGDIDYQQIEYLAYKNKPKMIIGGFSSYSGLANWKLMREIADSVNAYLLVDMSHIAGLIVAHLYPNPLSHAHIVTSTTHKTLSGPRGGIILSNEKDESLYKKINSSVFPGTQGGPLVHVIAAKAVAFKEAMEIDFHKYQKKILLNAKIMSKNFIENNFDLVSNGTNNHLFVINLTNLKITGKQAEHVLQKANITVNKNSIPYDVLSPFVTSGIRIGTPAITRRGFTELDAYQVSEWIIKILKNIDNETVVNMIKKEVIKLCQQYPVYIK